MKKKTILLLSLLGGMIQTAFAVQPYIGGTLGLGTLNGSYKAYSGADNHAATIAGTSFLGGAIAGLSTNLGCFYSALELNALYDSYDNTIRKSTNALGTINHAVNVQNNFQYGAIIKIGVNYNNVVPYVLGGIEIGNWKLKLTNESSISNRGIPANTTLSTSRTLHGPRAGVGVKILLTSNFNLDLQYAYTWFGNASVNLVDAVTSQNWNHSANINQGSALLALTYSFC